MMPAWLRGKAAGAALASFAAGLLVASGIFMTSHHDRAGMMFTSAQRPSPDFQREMDVGMARMMKDMHAPGYSGNVDIDFLAMMIPHHEGAVEMARLVLQHGRDPATRTLADEIIAGQTVEIEGMSRRLGLLRQGRPAGAPEDFPALGGTRGP